MSLTPGARFGPYEVTALIGVGGMGEVYRALDTSLRREVALKILPDVFVDDANRLARLQREAELLAALNHPNIAHVYGLERSGGLIGLYHRFLVWEMFSQPRLTRALEWLLNPVIGKSEVFYARKRGLVRQLALVRPERRAPVQRRLAAAVCMTSVETTTRNGRGGEVQDLTAPRLQGHRMAGPVVR